MKVTKAHFNRYKKEILRLMDKAGSGDWGAEFRHKKLDEGVEALIEVNDDATLVYFSYTTEMIKPHGVDPECAARHEFAHMISWRLQRLIETRYISPGQVSDEMERFAVMCERLLV